MFKYQGDILHSVVGHRCKSLADSIENYKHPFYVYDIAALADRATFFKTQMPKQSKSFFAMKSNNNSTVLKTLKDAGYGVDVVSAGEMHKALEEKYLPSDIIFSGVGKTKEELTYAIDNDVLQINVESIPELKRIIDIANQKNKKPNVAIRINPDVEAKTHPYISTGFKENKFGIDLSQINDFLTLIQMNKNTIRFRGITMHVGSQIRDISVFRESILKGLSVFHNIQAQGFDIKVLDIGGGVGIDYYSDGADDHETIVKYAQVITELTKKFSGQLMFEPGRIIVARMGILISEVQYIKITPYKKFVILDAGMNHLMRPALYQAHHRIQSLKKITGPTDMFDVVGPICESADTLGFDRELPSAIKEGDLIAIMDVGAYGRVMSSHYNCHSLAQETII